MLKDETEEIERLSHTISVRMKQFLATIINECLELLGTPPCDHEVIVFGSLARNEMTPYSDFEWAILTNSEEEECKVFFRNLTNLVHLQVGQVFVVV
jgi:predicted nucleotidyltransferase